MKIKLPQLLFGSAVTLGLLAMTAGTLAYVVRGRKTASTHGVAIADYDPTPGRYASRTRLEFSTSPPRLRAGQTAIWSVKIVDPNQRDRHGQLKYVRSFVQDKGNLINLVVVSQDLEYFARLQPDYKDYGHFLLQATLPRAGAYRLYTDYIPYAGQREVAQQEIMVEGGTEVTAPKLIADPLSANGITKRVVAQNAAGQDGTAYQADLSPARFVQGRKSILHVTLRDSTGKTVPDTQPHFGAPARCAIVSQDGTIFLHPELVASASPGVKSSATVQFETQFPQGGLYKMWVQFKRNEEVITAPFVVQVAGASSGPASSRKTESAVGTKELGER